MQLLTTLSIKSIAELLPDGTSANKDLILAEYYKNISDVSLEFKLRPTRIPFLRASRSLLFGEA